MCGHAGNEVQDPGATALAEALKGNKTLKALYLTCTWRGGLFSRHAMHAPTGVCVCVCVCVAIQRLEKKR